MTEALDFLGQARLIALGAAFKAVRIGDVQEIYRERLAIIKKEAIGSSGGVYAVAKLKNGDVVAEELETFEKGNDVNVVCTEAKNNIICIGLGKKGKRTKFCRRVVFKPNIREANQVEFQIDISTVEDMKEHLLGIFKRNKSQDAPMAIANVMLEFKKMNAVYQDSIFSAAVDELVKEGKILIGTRLMTTGKPARVLFVIKTIVLIQ